MRKIGYAIADFFSWLWFLIQGLFAGIAFVLLLLLSFVLSYWWAILLVLIALKVFKFI